MLNTVGWLRRVGAALLFISRPVAGLAAAGWMAVIWWMSSFSPPPAPQLYGWRAVLQNFLHAPAFGVLALLILLTLPRRAAWPAPTMGERWFVVLGALGYGIVDEIHQWTVPGRNLSVLDLATDLAGATCVLVIVLYLGRPTAAESGLARRFALGMLACLLCATAAAYGPKFFPEIAWF